MSSLLMHGDCLEMLKDLPDDSIDAIVTDPPYGWRFMGKAWDAFDIEKLRKQELARPPRKDGKSRGRGDPSLCAGSNDQSLAGNKNFQLFTEDWAREAFRVLKPGGHMLVFCGPRTYHRMAAGVEDAGFEIRDQLQWIFGSGFPKSHNLKGEHEGFGTALKPANEPICLARKPLIGTVAKNVQEFGTGALNIDASRIEFQSEKDLKSATFGSQPKITSKGVGSEGGTFQGFAQGVNATNVEANPQGRWPANVLFDEEAAALLGEPSRFFYVAKSSKRERNAGLEGMPEKATHRYGAGIGEGSDPNAPSNDKNHHPTVKPIKLMEYLVRMITPPGGVVLDPFMGSGTTGIAAKKLGFDFIGIEREAEYIAIAEKRIG